jgi:transposase InsO family protein
MTLDESIQALRRRVIQRAQVLGNVSQACREAGISRTVFYRWRHRFEQYGPDGLHPRRRHARPGRPPRLAPTTERLILASALAWPTWGCARHAAQLAYQHAIRVAPSTVQRCLRRHGLSRRRERLAVLERTSAATTGLVTERTRRELARARRRAGRHVQAHQPGELVSMDTFYIGQLKGVGKVWQVTACDVASSYGIAWLLPTFSAEATARFLRTILVPHVRRAGWALRRVLTDGGSEFKGAFAAACQALGIRQTRTKPRHAWTNGFVERLQGTLLHEHWRVAFRRRYFTSRAALQHALDTFLRFYNHERPHQGYRLRGHTPATLFWGVPRPERQVS